MSFKDKMQNKWARFWMKFMGVGYFGRMALTLSALGLPPFYGKLPLSRLNKRGYISPHAKLHHSECKLGRHIYIDEGVMIFQDQNGGAVEIGDSSHLHRDTIIQTGFEGSVTIGNETHVQPRCQFSAYKGPINIGCRVEIAPTCAFYSYDHGMLPGFPVREQPICTRGGIILDDDVWLGYGVIVLPEFVRL